MLENIITTSQNLKQGRQDKVIEQTLIQTEKALDRAAIIVVRGIQNYNG